MSLLDQKNGEYARLCHAQQDPLCCRQGYGYVNRYGKWMLSESEEFMDKVLL